MHTEYTLIRKQTLHTACARYVSILRTEWLCVLTGCPWRLSVFSDSAGSLQWHFCDIQSAAFLWPTPCPLFILLSLLFIDIQNFLILNQPGPALCPSHVPTSSLFSLKTPSRSAHLCCSLTFPFVHAPGPSLVPGPQSSSLAPKIGPPWVLLSPF